MKLEDEYLPRQTGPLLREWVVEQLAQADKLHDELCDKVSHHRREVLVLMTMVVPLSFIAVILVSPVLALGAVAFIAMALIWNVAGAYNAAQHDHAKWESEIYSTALRIADGIHSEATNQVDIERGTI